MVTKTKRMEMNVMRWAHSPGPSSQAGNEKKKNKHETMKPGKVTLSAAWAKVTVNRFSKTPSLFGRKKKADTRTIDKGM